MTLDKSLIPAPLMDALRACLGGRENWPLFVWGSFGVGKTSAARILREELLRAGKSVWGRRAIDFTREAADLACDRLMDPRGEKIGFQTYRKKVRSADLVVLDDMDVAGTVTETGRKAVYWLLEERQGRPTILIANGGPMAVRRLYGGAVHSRVLAGVVVEVRGPDRRAGNGGKFRVEGVEEF